MCGTNVLSDFINFFTAAVSPCTACIPGQHLLRVRGTHRRRRYRPWTRNRPQHVWGRFTFCTMRRGRKRRTGRGTDEQTERQRRRQWNKFEKRCYVTCIAVCRLLLTYSNRNSHNWEGIPIGIYFPLLALYWTQWNGTWLIWRFSFGSHPGIVIVIATAVEEGTVRWTDVTPPLVIYPPSPILSSLLCSALSSSV